MKLSANLMESPELSLNRLLSPTWCLSWTGVPATQGGLRSHSATRRDCQCCLFVSFQAFCLPFRSSILDPSSAVMNCFLNTLDWILYKEALKTYFPALKAHIESKIPDSSLASCTSVSMK